MPIITQDDQVLYALDEISPKDDKFKLWKRAANQAANLFLIASNDPNFSDHQRYTYHSQFQKISNCSSYLHFGIDDGDLKLAAANFCRSRFCPICQWRRRLKLSATAKSKIDFVLEKYPDHRWLFGTLTIQNCKLNQLSATIDHLQLGFSRLIGSRSKKHSGAARYLQPLFKDGFGIFRTIEVTRGRGVFDSNGKFETCHPHIHFLLLVSPNYSRKNPHIWLNSLPSPGSLNPSWSELWQSALQIDYQPIVDFRYVRRSNLQHDLNELFKYCAKPSDLSFSRGKDKKKLSFSVADLHFPNASAKYQAGLYDQLSGKRLYGSSGIFRKFSEQLNDDDLIKIIEKTTPDFTDFLSFNWWSWDKNEKANNYVFFAD